MGDTFGKVLSLIVGAAIAVGFGVLGVGAWRDYRTFDDVPTRSTLLAAVDASTNGRRWVSIEGAAWRCGQLVRNIRGGAAFLPASADDGSMVVARFDRPIQCDAVSTRPLTGIIEPMEDDRAADLRAAGLALADGARLRTLDVCASCGKANARLGVIVCSCFVLLGLFLYPLRRAYLSFRGRADASLQAAIHTPGPSAHADRTVRTWGGAALIAGAAAFAVGQGWVAYGIIPVRWIGVVALALGAWMTVFPAKYRALSARARRGSPPTRG
ncbi:MAG: hypothetical protein QM820_32175 [Minicystis sp.]